MFVSPQTPSEFYKSRRNFLKMLLSPLLLIQCRLPQLEPRQLSLAHSLTRKTMLFTKVAALALFPLLAVATPWGTPTTTPPVTVTVTATATATQTALSQCNVSNQQCCNSVQSSSTPEVSTLLGLLGVVLGGVTAQVGLTCSPLTIIGVSGTSCTAQPVCCENNSFNGLIAIGCTPINLNL